MNNLLIKPYTLQQEFINTIYNDANERIKLVYELGGIIDKKAIESLVYKNNIEMLKYFGITDFHPECARIACYSSYTKDAEMLRYIHSFNKNILKKYRWYHYQYWFENTINHITNSFHNASNLDHINVIKYLHENAEYTYEDIKYALGASFGTDYGKNGIVMKYLIKLYNDIDFYNHGIIGACLNEDLDNLYYIIGYINSTNEKIKITKKTMEILSTKNNNIDFIKTLILNGANVDTNISDL